MMSIVTRPTFPASTDSDRLERNSFPMARQGSVVGDSILSTAGVLAQGLSRFAYTAIVGRMLGADVLSTVNVAFSVSILLSLVWPTAAGNAAAAFLRCRAQRDRVSGARSRARWAISFLPLGVAAVVLAVVLGGSAGDAAILAALTFAWSGYIFGRGARMGLGQVRAAAGMGSGHRDRRDRLALRGHHPGRGGCCPGAGHPRLRRVRARPRFSPPAAHGIPRRSSRPVSSAAHAVHRVELGRAHRHQRADAAFHGGGLRLRAARDRRVSSRPRCRWRRRSR